MVHILRARRKCIIHPDLTLLSSTSHLPGTVNHKSNLISFTPFFVLSKGIYFKSPLFKGNEFCTDLVRAASNNGPFVRTREYFSNTWLASSTTMHPCSGSSSDSNWTTHAHSKVGRERNSSAPSDVLPSLQNLVSITVSMPGFPFSLSILISFGKNLPVRAAHYIFGH